MDLGDSSVQETKTQRILIWFVEVKMRALRTCAPVQKPRRGPVTRHHQQSPNQTKPKCDQIFSLFGHPALTADNKKQSVESPLRVMPNCEEDEVVLITGGKHKNNTATFLRQAGKTQCWLKIHSDEVTGEKKVWLSSIKKKEVATTDAVIIPRLKHEEQRANMSNLQQKLSAIVTQFDSLAVEDMEQAGRWDHTRMREECANSNGDFS